MRKERFIAALCAAILAGSVTAEANEGAYLGISGTGYYLDSEREITGHDESGVVGINLGYRFSADWALEGGYGESVAADDLDVSRLSFIHYLGEEKDRGWRPFFLFGGSYYDRTGVPGLQPSQGYTHQLDLGFGLANSFSDHLEFRADTRLLHKLRDDDNTANDLALNLQFNYYFSSPKPAPVVEEPVAAASVYVEPEPQPEPEVRTITVRLNVEFELNKAVVQAIYGQELGAIANAMKAHDDIDLVLEGHSDNTGEDDYNLDLSKRRAAAVKDKLVEDYGIDASRISTVGYGESRPIADNSTKEGRARNRRVIGEMSFSEVMPD